MQHPFKPLAPGFAVTGQLSPADFALAAASGFRSVLNFRPDGEAAGQLTALDAGMHARAAGLHYAAIPVSKFDVFADEVVSAAAAALASLPGPVLAYCESGQRAAIIWAAATARSEPVSDVLSVLAAAGFRLEFLRDDLDQQAGRAAWVDDGTAQQATNAALPAATPGARAAA